MGSRHPNGLAGGTVAAALLLGACGPLRPTAVPIPTVAWEGLEGTDSLFVLLPGRGDSAEDYGERGFVAAAREAGVTTEIIAADAHLGYYYRRNVHTRLKEDVLAPARARGIHHVWMGGISLGGLGSIIVAREFPGEVEGLVIIAPYLGPDGLLRRIEKAGGLRSWTPPEDPDDFEGLWGWLRGYAVDPAARPPLLLAYGEDDRYGLGHRLLAEALPPERVVVAPGGHDWSTWRALWLRLLRHPALARGLGALPPHSSAQHGQ